MHFTEKTVLRTDEVFVSKVRYLSQKKMIRYLSEQNDKIFVYKTDKICVFTKIKLGGNWIKSQATAQFGRHQMIICH